ncbi:MAG TPA: hypothetical protein VMS93_04665 [Candidatus Saccharimonadales bacterium]|nr:hypothetical protein [Candidatus Saccharimonadales bacterium]
MRTERAGACAARAGRLACVLALLALPAGPGRAGDIAVRGAVRCLAKAGSGEEEPVGGIVVYPQDRPDLAVETSTGGFFEIRIPSKALVGRHHELLFAAPGRLVGLAPLDVSEDRLERWGKLTVYRPSPVVLDAACAALDSVTRPDAVVKTLDRLRANAPPESRSGAKAGFASSAAGIVGGLVAHLAGAPAGPPSPGDTLHVISEAPSLAIQRGLFWLGQSSLAPDIGFSLAPIEDYDQAALWNASALPFAPTQEVMIEAGSERLIRAAGSFRLADGLAVGVGSVLLSPTQGRRVQLQDGSTESPGLPFTESLTTLGVGRALSPWLAVGAAARLAILGRDLPLAYVDHPFADPPSRQLVSSWSWRHAVDLDFSATVRPAPGLKVAAVAMNVLGSEKFYGWEHVPSIRGAGFGASLERGRLRLGGQANLREGEIPSFSAGLGWRVAGSVVVSGGAASLDQAWQAGLAWRSIQYRYINSESLGNIHSLILRVRL